MHFKSNTKYTNNEGVYSIEEEEEEEEEEGSCE
jgi:hypothetical protein